MEYKINDTVFKVYPEYTLRNKEDYIPSSVDVVVIGGVQEFNQTKIIIATSMGVVFERAKKRLCSMESDKIPGTSPTPFLVNGFNVLALSCSEILYPEDFFHFKNIDLVTHSVGFEMYNIHQYKAWKALQKSIVEHFKCPLICCSGGETGELNLTGIIVDIKQ